MRQSEIVDVHVLNRSELERLSSLLPKQGPACGKVLIKPNWVRHFNERAPDDGSRLAEVVTSSELLVRLIEVSGPLAKELVIADAPQFDTKWDVLFARAGLKTVEAAAALFQGELRDLRQEVVETDRNDVIVSRRRANGDPAGYRIVDVGGLSAFTPLDRSLERLRGSDYDSHETIRHHSDGRHEYCVAGSVLDADLIVNVPKVKTHKKAGVTLCLKNLVGINGNKNYLPHHRAGSASVGGDEFPERAATLYQRGRATLIDIARPLLNSVMLRPLIRAARAADVRTRPASLIRNGNWWGNDTIWRTILDLNRVLLYADRQGKLQESKQRATLHVMDALIAGEGDGPMGPSPRDMGRVIVSSDPVAADIVASALMGFDPLRIPVIKHALVPNELPITSLGPAAEGLRVHIDGRSLVGWQDLPSYDFAPHPNWRGHIERSGRASLRVG